jgi:hypothetical protein
MRCNLLLFSDVSFYLTFYNEYQYFPLHVYYMPIGGPIDVHHSLNNLHIKAPITVPSVYCFHRMIATVATADTHKQDDSNNPAMKLLRSRPSVQSSVFGRWTDGRLAVSLCVMFMKSQIVRFLGLSCIWAARPAAWWTSIRGVFLCHAIWAFHIYQRPAIPRVIRGRWRIATYMNWRPDNW